MFGSQAHYVEAAKVLSAGEYEASIVSISESVENGFSMMKTKLSVRGYAGYQPDTFTLFDVDVSATAKMQEWASKRISRFCDATGASITPTGLNTAAAIGKKVIAVVERKDSGFMDITRLEKPGTKSTVSGRPESDSAEDAEGDLF